MIYNRQMKEKVDPIIKKMLAQGVRTQTRELLHYQIITGGKRLRPALAITSCLACGGKLKDALYPAAALEILHTYTLIIDDIIDNSPTRRGKQTTWKKFGRSFAECAGLDYGATILQTILKTKQPNEIGTILANTWKEIIDGEILDILYEQSGKYQEPFARLNRKTTISLREYQKMISHKTASLFRASCEIGAIAAKAPQKEIEALKTYGWNFGLAFQISDDILDIYGTNTGKPRGQDIREHKLGNIVVLLALRDLPHKQQNRLRNILKKGAPQTKDLKEAIALIQNSNAKQKALQLLSLNAKKARQALHQLHVSPHRAALEAILQKSVAIHLPS